MDPGQVARVAALGRIMQLGYVPYDFDVALRYWTAQMGVGPFYILDHVVYDEVIYRGEPIFIEAKVAIANWGDIQVELIHQYNDEVVSVYTEDRPLRRQGLHHICVDIGDVALDTALQLCLDRSGELLMVARTDAAGRFLYIDMGNDGPHVELLDLTPKYGAALFGFVADQSRTWDGSDPVRMLPDEAVWNPHQLT